MTDLATLVVRLEAQTAQFQASLEAANKKLSSFGHSANTSLAELQNNLVKGLAGFFAISKGIDASKKSVENFLGVTSRLSTLSKETGISATALSTLEGAAQLSSVSIETFDDSLIKLAKSQSEVVHGSKDQLAAFNEIGISLADIQQLSIDALFKKIATNISGYADSGEKATVVTKLFGKGSAELVGFLNQGATGIEQLQARVRALGGELSGEAIEKGEAAEQAFKQMDIAAAGASRQFAQALLPALTDLAKFLTTSTLKTDDANNALRRLGEGGGIILKGIASVAATAAAGIKDLAAGLGAIFAARSLASDGKFKEALQVFKEFGSDVVANQDTLTDQLEAIWGTRIPAVVQTGAEKAADAAKKGLKGVDEEAQKAALSALHSLEQFSQGLGEQIATFDATDAAAIRYRLTIGTLSDEVNKAGAAGEKLAQSIERQAEVLDHLKRAKEIADGLAGVNAQLLEISGRAGEAAVAQFDISNLQLYTAAVLDGNNAALVRLDILRELVGAQADYTAQQTEAQAVQENLGAIEERIRNSQATGAISELEALSQLDSARSGAVDQLTAIYTQMKAISDLSGNPALINNTIAFGHQIEQLKSQTNLFAQKFKTIFQDGFSNAFADFVTGAKSAGEAFKSFASSVIQQIVKIAAQVVASKFFEILGAGSGSSGSGRPSLFGIALQAFQAYAGASGGLGGGGTGGGNIGAVDVSGVIPARAAGGPVSSGSAYLVGEHGPEYFIPDVSGRIDAGGNQAPIVNLYEMPNRAGEVSSRKNNGRMEIDVFVSDIRGGGDRSRTLEDTYGLTRVGR